MDWFIEKSVVVVDVIGDVYYMGLVVVEMMLVIGFVDLMFMVVWWGFFGEVGMVVVCINEEDFCVVYSVLIVEVLLLYVMVK